MPTIILSYRRDDTRWIAGRIFDRLSAHYGRDRVFMDIDAIPIGTDFREHIHQVLEKCDIMLVLIGPRWAAPIATGKSRLFDEADWVRVEIESALAKHIPVIPLCIDDAILPPAETLPKSIQELVFRQAAKLDTERNFNTDMDHLIRAMDLLLNGHDWDSRTAPLPAETGAAAVQQREHLAKSLQAPKVKSSEPTLPSRAEPLAAEADEAPSTAEPLSPPAADPKILSGKSTPQVSRCWGIGVAGGLSVAAVIGLIIVAAVIASVFTLIEQHGYSFQSAVSKLESEINSLFNLTESREPQSSQSADKPAPRSSQSANQPAPAAPQFPQLTGRVVDDAKLLGSADEQALTADLKALEDKNSDQLVVVTLPSLQGYTIEDYGYQLGRRWGIGSAKLNNGVLLIVAPNEHKVRIEVGYGLETTLTDEISKSILDNSILPRFREGNYAAGIKDGVNAIIAVLTGQQRPAG